MNMSTFDTRKRAECSMPANCIKNVNNEITEEYVVDVRYSVGGVRRRHRHTR